MNRNQRRMAAYNARKAAESMKDVKPQKSIGMALAGCSSRVFKAVSLIDYKASPRSLRTIGIERDDNKSGATCLPQVAIYNAGHRKGDGITAR